MKKVINGKMFNTESAKMLGRWENDFPTNDFSYCKEELYLTKSGNYFLYGTGGPLSIYGKRIGSNIHGDSVINAFTESEAKEWAEEHLSGDEYENAFELEEDDKGYISAYINQSDIDKINRIKEETGETTADVISRLLKTI